MKSCFAGLITVLLMITLSGCVVAQLNNGYFGRIGTSRNPNPTVIMNDMYGLVKQQLESAGYVMIGQSTIQGSRVFEHQARQFACSKCADVAVVSRIGQHTDYVPLTTYQPTTSYGTANIYGVGTASYTSYGSQMTTHNYAITSSQYLVMLFCKVNSEKVIRETTIRENTRNLKQRLPKLKEQLVATMKASGLDYETAMTVCSGLKTER